MPCVAPCTSLKRGQPSKALPHIVSPVQNICAFPAQHMCAAACIGSLRKPAALTDNCLIMCATCWGLCSA